MIAEGNSFCPKGLPSKSASSSGILSLCVVAFLFSCLFEMTVATKYLEETFDTEIEGRWITSSAQPNYGKVRRAHGHHYGDAEINTGLQTMEDSHFYAVSTPLSEPFNNRDKTMIFSFSVKHEQNIECGGGYLKLLPDMDLTQYNGESEYLLMFGLDICGHTRKLHVIIHYQGKNHLWRKNPPVPVDTLTHVYTIIVRPDNTYEVQIDTERVEGGLVDEDWNFVLPKKIVDPNSIKPSDWNDTMMIDDPEDIKPKDWVDGPTTIPDHLAEQPSDWDAEEDGQWEPPHMPNPAFRGTWKPKQIPNPTYKGPWIPKEIPNPDFVPNDELYILHQSIFAVGIDIWQVRAGTIFDSIILSDDIDEVKTWIASTWGVTQQSEKDMMKKLREEDKLRQIETPPQEGTKTYEQTMKDYDESVAGNEDL